MNESRPGRADERIAATSSRCWPPTSTARPPRATVTRLLAHVRRLRQLPRAAAGSARRAKRFARGATGLRACASPGSRHDAPRIAPRRSPATTGRRCRGRQRQPRGSRAASSGAGRRFGGRDADARRRRRLRVWLNDKGQALAFQSTLDHVKCASLLPRPLMPTRSPRRGNGRPPFGWPLAVPPRRAGSQLELRGVRRCAVTDGRVAHLIYCVDGRAAVGLTSCPSARSAKPPSSPTASATTRSCGRRTTAPTSSSRRTGAILSSIRSSPTCRAKAY